MTKLCWICGNPADSREHKFKKTDVERAGGAWSLAERPSLLNHEGLSVIQGPRADSVKFGKVLCTPCNTTRSQPWDKAYEIFSGWVNDAGSGLMTMETLDFEGIFGAASQQAVLNLLKYLLKHFGCQLADRDYTIPFDLADLFDRSDLAPFQVSFARNRYWYEFERGGSGLCGNFAMFGTISRSTGRISPPYLSGIQIGCLDIVYRYGDFEAYPWEGQQFSAPLKAIDLGLYDQNSGQPHFHSELPPGAAEFTIGGRRFLAPLLSPQQRAQINAMPSLSADNTYVANLDACLGVITVLMGWFYPEIDREFLENNLTPPEMNDLLRAFHLNTFGG